jgi:hypothetical protein
MVLEPVALQGGGFPKGGSLFIAVGTKFMMLQKRILRHIELETKKLISKAKERQKHSAQPRHGCGCI